MAILVSGRARKPAANDSAGLTLIERSPSVAGLARVGPRGRRSGDDGRLGWQDTCRRLLHFTVPRVVAVSPQMRLIEDNPSSMSLLQLYKQVSGRRRLSG